MEEAGGYRQRMEATAEGDASRFKQLLTEYTKAPEVTRQRLYLETMQQIYSNTSKVMVDAKGQGNLLYLPLDKLMNAATAATTSAATANVDSAIQPRSPGPAVTEAVAVPATEKAPTAERGLVRDRDAALRSRDRESR